MFQGMKKKDLNLIIAGSLFVFVSIVIGIISSSEILKKETIDNQITISKLNGSFLSEDLNQKINNIELFIENISSLIDLSENKNITNSKLMNSLNRLPIIRSINILEENKIIYSSNESNIGLFINEKDFIPEPLFENNILKVSAPWKGRDFSTGIKIQDNQKINKDDLSFIPILKKTNINYKNFTVIVNLNSDFILGNFDKRSVNNKFEIELLRIDNLLLVSNNTSFLAKKRTTTKLLEDAIEFNNATGIEQVIFNKRIATYTVIKDYPFIISIHLDYEDSLLSWNEKKYKFFIISISIVVICIFIVLILILMYRKEKEAEIALQKQLYEDQEKFRHLFNDSHHMSAVLDKEGKILDINNSALEFLNMNIKNTINEFFWNLDCWGYEQRKYLKKIFKNKNLITINEEILSLDKFKKDATLEFSIYTISKNSDEYQYIAMGQNITERKEKEKKLLQAYTVFNNTRDGIMITDKYTNILEVNEAFENITGHSKKEIIGKNTRILKSNLHDEKFYIDMWKNIDESRYWEGEITNSKKDKSFYTEWLTINAILDENTDVVNYIGIFSDITKEKEKEFLLKEKESVIYQQSKMASMGEMIENIAHQWRQPLSVISTVATGIKIQKEFGSISSEAEIKDLDLINETTQYLSETIDDFRNFLKNDKELKLFDLNAALVSAIKLIDAKLKNRNIQIINNCIDIQINGLRNEFIQVIINILNNAKDALEESSLENKYIFISSYIKDDYAIINIKNNGGKIPEKIINRIFEPYFSTKHKSQGTGIGLYMSNEIIKNHMKGLILVKNENFSYKGEDFEGPCFTIELMM